MKERVNTMRNWMLFFRVKYLGFSFKLIIPVAMFFLTTSCKEDIGIPEVTTVMVSDITLTNAISGGIVTSDGGSAVTDRGICWGENSTPDLSMNVTYDSSGIGLYTSYLYELSPSTTYYVRSYATNKAGTGYGQIKSFTTNVIDIDGNVYHTVKVGHQTWLGMNLKTTKFNNGNQIPHVTSSNDWMNMTSAAYTWYNNDEETNKNPYGALYNWYVFESGEICPQGWHVPSNVECTTLLNYVGETGGGLLKEMGLEHWRSPNTDATNEMNFTAVPGGSRNEEGIFSLMGICFFMWTTTEYSTSEAYLWSIQNNYNGIYSHNASKKRGLCVRCLQN